MPLVSVILSTYNWNNKWLDEAIKSVLNQSFTDFEFIIINDASTNDIEQIILKYQKLDNRIIYHKNRVNLERSKSRNIWIKLANWKYISFIDDDDIWNKSKLKKQVNFMENNDSYWICWTSVIIVNEKSKFLNKIKNRQYDIDIRNNIGWSNQFTHSSIMLRSSILNNSWLFNINYYLAEDYDLRLRIWIKSYFYNLPEFLTKYRISSNNTSSKNKNKLNFYALKIFLKYIKFYPNRIINIIKHILVIILPNFLINKLIKISKS